MGEIAAEARARGFDNLEHAARQMGAMFGVTPNIQAMHSYYDQRGKLSQFMVVAFAAFFRAIDLEKELAGL